MLRDHKKCTCARNVCREHGGEARVRRPLDKPSRTKRLGLWGLDPNSYDKKNQCVGLVHFRPDVIMALASYQEGCKPGVGIARGGLPDATFRDEVAAHGKTAVVGALHWKAQGAQLSLGGVTLEVRLLHSSWGDDLAQG